MFSGWVSCSVDAPRRSVLPATSGQGPVTHAVSDITSRQLRQKDACACVGAGPGGFQIPAAHQERRDSLSGANGSVCRGDAGRSPSAESCGDSTSPPGPACPSRSMSLSLAIQEGGERACDGVTGPAASHVIQACGSSSAKQTNCMTLCCGPACIANATTCKCCEAWPRCHARVGCLQQRHASSASIPDRKHTMPSCCRLAS